MNIRQKKNLKKKGFRTFSIRHLLLDAVAVIRDVQKRTEIEPFANETSITKNINREERSIMPRENTDVEK